MQIEVRNIDRTGLQLDAYIKTIKRYAKGLTHPIRVIFDNRICDFGSYNFVKERHEIRISAKKLRLPDEPKELRIPEETHRFIKATLHEIQHAQQWNKLRRKFYSKKFCRAQKKDPRDSYGSDWFSTCEQEARSYECQYAEAAIDLYHYYCK